MDIAFTMVIHKDILQVARLLRMIHRINNYYCIHLDARSTGTFREAVEGMARCFGANVELVPPEKRVAVVWGDESVLRPQLICGEQALERHQTWKYLINIVGQEFPLRTNLELIAALKALNGSNLTKWYKGSMYRAFRRDFIQEAVLSPVLRPVRDTLLRHRRYSHPDELFFTSFNYYLHLRIHGSGLHAPPPPEEVNLGILAQCVIWDDYGMICPIKYVRVI
ncbi:hypothetical protein Aperf_G00000123197 [Anoplocephala perfoliata]